MTRRYFEQNELNFQIEGSDQIYRKDYSGIKTCEGALQCADWLIQDNLLFCYTVILGKEITVVIDLEDITLWMD